MARKKKQVAFAENGEAGSADGAGSTPNAGVDGNHDEELSSPRVVAGATSPRVGEETTQARLDLIELSARELYEVQSMLREIVSYWRIGNLAREETLVPHLVQGKAKSSEYGGGRASREQTSTGAGAGEQADDKNNAAGENLGFNTSTARPVILSSKKPHLEHTRMSYARLLTRYLHFLSKITATDVGFLHMLEDLLDFGKRIPHVRVLKMWSELKSQFPDAHLEEWEVLRQWMGRLGTQASGSQMQTLAPMIRLVSRVIETREGQVALQDVFFPLFGGNGNAGATSAPAIANAPYNAGAVPPQSAPVVTFAGIDQMQSKPNLYPQQRSAGGRALEQGGSKTTKPLSLYEQAQQRKSNEQQLVDDVGRQQPQDEYRGYIRSRQGSSQQSARNKRTTASSCPTTTKIEEEKEVEGVEDVVEPAVAVTGGTTGAPRTTATAPQAQQTRTAPSAKGAGRGGNAGGAAQQVPPATAPAGPNNAAAGARGAQFLSTSPQRRGGPKGIHTTRGGAAKPPASGNMNGGFGTGVVLIENKTQKNKAAAHINRQADPRGRPAPSSLTRLPAESHDVSSIQAGGNGIAGEEQPSRGGPRGAFHTRSSSKQAPSPSKTSPSKVAASAASRAASPGKHQPHDVVATLDEAPPQLLQRDTEIITVGDLQRQQGDVVDDEIIEDHPSRQAKNKQVAIGDDLTKDELEDLTLSRELHPAYPVGDVQPVVGGGDGTTGYTIKDQHEDEVEEEPASSPDVDTSRPPLTARQAAGPPLTRENSKKADSSEISVSSASSVSSQYRVRQSPMVLLAEPGQEPRFIHPHPGARDAKSTRRQVITSKIKVDKRMEYEDIKTTEEDGGVAQHIEPRFTPAVMTESDKRRQDKRQAKLQARGDKIGRESNKKGGGGGHHGGHTSPKSANGKNKTNIEGDHQFHQSSRGSTPTITEEGEVEEPAVLSSSPMKTSGGELLGFIRRKKPPGNKLAPLRK
ncbi:unnamed protein product [Amoebophrya sp. A25]|nr:unnamed protein product [Amoebophrya sp. A25]|eukprot:GSA25T00003496001.1